MNYWLLKTEPKAFSIHKLSSLTNQEDVWDGVRNYQARNFLKSMQRHDLAFFYHSSCEIPGIAGIVEITRAGIVDPTQFNPDSDYYDPKSTLEQPRWITVEIKLVKKLDFIFSLSQLRTLPELHNWALLNKGNRLSVLPVTPIQWQTICHHINTI